MWPTKISVCYQLMQKAIKNKVAQKITMVYYSSEYFEHELKKSVTG